MDKKEFVSYEEINLGNIGKYEYISSAIYEEKKSKFYSYIFNVQSKENINNIIAEFKKEFKDARHVVYAYSLIDSYNYSDDGEPSGTAGKIIYSLLEKQQLVNTLVIVVRYFGGILLGTGPLSRAYLKVTKLAEEKLNIVKYIPKDTINLIIEYNDELSLKRIIKDSNAEVLNVEYNDKILYKIKVAIDNLEVFKKYQKSS